MEEVGLFEARKFILMRTSWCCQVSVNADLQGFHGVIDPSVGNLHLRKPDKVSLCAPYFLMEGNPQGGGFHDDDPVTWISYCQVHGTRKETELYTSKQRQFLGLKSPPPGSHIDVWRLPCRHLYDIRLDHHARSSPNGTQKFLFSMGCSYSDFPFSYKRGPCKTTRNKNKKKQRGHGSQLELWPICQEMSFAISKIRCSEQRKGAV